MLDPVSVLSYAQTIVAITSLLQKRHKNHQAEFNSINEGHKIAREIDRLASELPKSLEIEVEDEIVQLGSTLSDIRESYSSAKTCEDLEDTTDRLRDSRAKLSSILGKYQNARKPDEEEPSYRLSLSVPGSEDQLSPIPSTDQNGAKPDEGTRSYQPWFAQTVWVEAGGSRRQIPAKALLDSGSRVNLASERFLNSLETSPSWSAAIRRRLFRFGGTFSRSSYRWSRDSQDWLGVGHAELKISLSQSSPQVHGLSFTVHRGASFFGDLLLGENFLQTTGILRQPSIAAFGQQGLVPIHDRQERAAANIILVHSLYGNASETWRGKSNSFWPKDFLAKDLETCSIWTYGYDVNQTRSKLAKSFERMMDDLANDLLEQVDQYTNKPILWICHSLGGHLVKSALTRSRARSRRLSDQVSRSSKTTGVIFLGTPHGASTSVDVFEDIMAISRGSREGSGKEIKLRSHKFDNSLAYTASAFACLMDREYFPILSLFENKPMLTRRGPRKIVLPFTRMHHPEERWDYLEGDHLSMCRFETKEERGYKKILASVRDLLEGKGLADIWQDGEVDVQGRSCSMHTSVSDEELVDIDKIYLNLRLKIDLQTTRWHSPKSEDNADSKWIRSDPLLTEWLDGKQKKPFLIRGPIGCGKSKIAESLQEWLDVPQHRSSVGNPNSRSCHLQLFFKSDQRSQQTLTTMLEFLIAQILDQNETLVYHVSKRKLFSKGLPQSLARATLQGTLRIMLEDSCWSSIFLVVDALDECNPEYAAAILETLNFIFKIDNVKALLTISTTAANLSENEITESPGTPFNAFIAKNQCVTLDLPQNNTWRQVLAQYLEDRLLQVSDEVTLLAKNSERLKGALLRLPNLSFFVIDLALQHLQNVLSGEDSNRQDLFEAQLAQMKARARIDGLLIDLANTRPETGHWVLSVLACAFEPLRLQELASIFVRDPEAVWEGVKGDQLRTSALLQSLADNDLRQLVRIDGDGLHLANQSVRRVINDRMARSEINHPDASKTERGWSNSQQLHLRLSKICLQMLLENITSRKTSESDAKMAPLPAEGYARRHWENHLREAGNLASDINSLVMRWIQAQKESQHGEVKGPSDTSTILLKRLTDDNLFRTMGSVFDDTSLGLQLPDPDDFDRVLEQSIPASTPDTLQVLRDISKRIGDDDDTAKLFFAMAEGDKSTLSRLLMPLEASRKSTYLHKAIEMQDEGIVQIILDSYSEIHQLPEKNDELCYAVGFQSYGIFSRMLTRKELFDLDSALLAAVNAANFSMCEALLASGAKVCLIETNEPARTPLHIAAQRGKRELVDLMLNWNAPVNIKDSKDQTPLHHAAKSGRIDIIEALLAGSASVVATDNQGWTALFTACAFGQVEAARLLWSSGASIFHRDHYGRSMLHSGTKYGHMDVVSMLLLAGISAECTDMAGITPIHEGCQSGWAPIVDKLLQTGASINAADSRDRTFLHYACQCRNVPESIVQLLLDMGADASARDKDGCTPLMLAAQFSTVRVLKIFWTHDQRLFRDADQKGWRVLDYLHAKGNLKTGGNYTEKVDFLASYYSKSGQASESKMGTVRSL